MKKTRCVRKKKDTKKGRRKNPSLELDRLKSALVDRDREIRALTEISRAMVSGRYIQDVLNIIVSITAEMLDSKICSIMVLENNDEELKIVSTQSLSEAYKLKGNVRVGTSISGRVVTGKTPITVKDVRKEPAYMYKKIAEKEGLVSMLAVPMMLKGRVLGVINIYTASEHEFSESEISILQAVANQAAIGIENENLSIEVTSAKNALETRKLIDRAKGILMSRFNIAEEAAYKMIHKKSMDSRKSMKEVAEAIILTVELEKQRD